MNKKLLFTLFALCLFISQQAKAQCVGFPLSAVTVDFSDAVYTFPDVGGGDIANGGNLTAGPFSFDIFDEITGVVGPGGADDITISFEIFPTVDIYGGIIEGTTSTSHQIQQTGSGLRGTMAMGTSGATDATTGDVRCYSITVTFASHVQITAADATALVTSVNTAGEAYESMSIVFLDAAGAPYGTADYTGYYSTPPTGTVGGMLPAVVAADAWTVTGTGVYLADSPVTVDHTTDPFNPFAAVNGDDNLDPNAATDAGLAGTDLVGGAVFTVCLEDIAATVNDGDITTSATSFTSTFNGFDFAEVCLGTILLSSELNNFSAEAENCESVLNWSTLSETGVSKFIIERSTDGINFEQIGFVNAAGTTQQLTNYNFVDANPGFLSYYRLLILDQDGTMKYSEISATSPDCGSKLILNALRPNPVSTNLSVDIQSNVDDAPINLVVTSLVGQKIIEQTNVLALGANELNVNTSNLKAGVYIIQLVQENGTVFTRKFVKSN